MPVPTFRRIISVLLPAAILIGVSGILFGVPAIAAADIEPAKTWFAPGQPLVFRNTGDQPTKLILTNFTNTPEPLGGDGEAAPVLQPGDEIDLRTVYAAINVGTYLLYSVPADEETILNFVGTPHVIGVRRDDRPEAPDGPLVIKVEPLHLAEIETDFGTMQIGFYYDVAPHTVANFLELAGGGFYDGLTFHRIVPGFVVQGGDPKGDGTGGPGYRIDAEFNDRPHLPGALSMAREGDPIEQEGAPPRDRAKNSAGSQFFIALNYETTRRLDGRYTVFARVTDGLDVVQSLGEMVIEDLQTGRPRQAPTIRRVRVLPVTAQRNPYAELMAIEDSDLRGEADSDGKEDSTKAETPAEGG